MPKLVKEKIRKIIENHVYLNGKLIEIHCKNKLFDGLEGCMCGRERYQKNIKNEINIHPQIDTKTMLEKGVPKR